MIKYRIMTYASTLEWLVTNVPEYEWRQTAPCEIDGTLKPGYAASPDDDRRQPYYRNLRLYLDEYSDTMANGRIRMLLREWVAALNTVTAGP